MRWLLGLFVALALPACAHAQLPWSTIPGPAPMRTPAAASPPLPTVTLLVPGSGSNPAVNPTQQGSGSIQMPVADFDEPPSIFINQGDAAHAITIGAATSNRGWIKQVTFCMAGNCTAPITAQIINPRTGDVGYTVIPTSAGGTDGDYTLSAYVTPVNGFERLISIPITLNNNGTLTRAQRFVDAVSGSDSNNGLTLGTAWKTLLHSAITAPSGSQVYTCGDETYLEDSNTGTFNNNARMIDFLINPTCPGATGYYTISRTTRTSPAAVWNPRANKLRFDHAHLDMTNIVQVQGSGSGAITWFSNSTANDSNGPTGPTYGYTSIVNGAGQPELAQTPFGSATSQVFFTDSTMSTVVTAGIQLNRNAVMTVGWDLVAWANPANNNNAAMFNVQGIKAGNFLQRLSLEQPSGVVVASSIYNSGTNQTTITYNAGPTLASEPCCTGGGADLQPVGGPLNGQTFVMVSQTPDPSTPNTVVTGDASTIGTGNSAFVYVIAHADAQQFIQLTAASAPITNIYIQRYKATANGSDLQALLEQPTPTISNTGTLSTVGTAVTFSTAQTLEQYDCIQTATDATHTTLLSWPLSANVAASTSGALVNAYSPDQTNVLWHQGKTIKDFAIVASIIDGANTELAQPQGCEINNVFVQDTLASSSFQFRTGTNGFGLWSSAFYDSLWNGSTGGTNSMLADVAPGFPAAGLSIDNNQFGVGTARGTNGVTNLATFAAMGSAATYKPTGGTVTKVLSGMVGNPNYPDGTPLFPYAYDLTSLSPSSVVGAQQP